MYILNFFIHKIVRFNKPPQWWTVLKTNHRSISHEFLHHEVLKERMFAISILNTKNKYS